jgi:hypothetical protein
MAGGYESESGNMQPHLHVQQHAVRRKRAVAAQSAQVSSNSNDRGQYARAQGANGSCAVGMQRIAPPTLTAASRREAARCWHRRCARTAGMHKGQEVMVHQEHEIEDEEGR